jgi:hypothetical protein
MKIRPLGDRILVQRIKEEDKTNGLPTFKLTTNFGLSIGTLASSVLKEAATREAAGARR